VGVRNTVACAAVRRSSELGFELVWMRKKVHPFSGKHTKCQSFTAGLCPSKCTVGPRNSSRAGAKKVPDLRNVIPHTGACLTAGVIPNNARELLRRAEADRQSHSFAPPEDRIAHVKCRSAVSIELWKPRENVEASVSSSDLYGIRAPGEVSIAR
jgi:hypothetical protein